MSNLIWRKPDFTAVLAILRHESSLWTSGGELRSRYTRTRSRKAPPRRLYTGVLRALPTRSHSAISTPLTAQMIGPNDVAVGDIEGMARMLPGMTPNLALRW